jgi:DNA-binding MarR family transcriptional regulator
VYKRQIIDRLEIKKLVKRSTSLEDRRETVITLTQGGISILAASTIMMEERYLTDLNLTESEAYTLTTLLEKLREKER